MNIDDIFNLEETISSDRVNRWIQFLIGNPFPDEKKSLVFDALFELSDKQWHNYERLETSVQANLENWIIKNMDLSDPEIINVILGITARLGLQEVFLELIQIAEKNNTINEEIRTTLKEGIEELKDSIDNPWLGME